MVAADAQELEMYESYQWVCSYSTGTGTTFGHVVWKLESGEDGVGAGVSG